MKKHISIIRLDPELETGLIAHLQHTHPDSPAARTLVADLQELLRGTLQSVVLDGTPAGAADAAGPPPPALRLGALTISATSHTVTLQDRPVNLTPKEFDILYFLARNRGQVFTKEEIYTAVWGHAYVYDDSNIMAFIRKLRKKIEVQPDSPQYILTVWGIGYKFNDRF